MLAAGITTVQVVANPLISMLGPARTASSRLTFAQAFNSLGTTIFPYVGSILILGSLATVDPATLSGGALDAFRGVETQVVVHTYMGLAIALTLLAAVGWLRRHASLVWLAVLGLAATGAVSIFPRGPASQAGRVLSALAGGALVYGPVERETAAASGIEVDRIDADPDLLNQFEMRRGIDHRSRNRLQHMQ